MVQLNTILWIHNVKTLHECRCNVALHERRCDVMTSHRRYVFGGLSLAISYFRRIEYAFTKLIKVWVEGFPVPKKVG